MRKHSNPTRGTAATKKPRRPADPLGPYRKDAARFVSMLFDDAVPAFVRDLLMEYFSEMENETQVFWNTREIAAVAFPFMLQAAAEAGIDYNAERNELFRVAVGSLYDRMRDAEERPAYSPADERQASLRRDADAIHWLLTSKTAPVEITNDLGDRAVEFIDHPIHDADTMRVAYPRAVLRRMVRQAEGGAGDE